MFNVEISLPTTCASKLKGMTNMKKTKNNPAWSCAFLHTIGQLGRQTLPLQALFFLQCSHIFSLLVSTFTARVPKSSKPSGIRQRVKDVSMSTTVCMCAWVHLFIRGMLQSSVETHHHHHLCADGYKCIRII